MLEWLIVGGGVHGTHLSHVLVSERGVRRDAIRVLDPHPRALARWDHCTENTGMRLLRSPYVHHLDTHPFSLRQFSRTSASRGLGGLVGFYKRPTLTLFRAHSERVIADHGLAELRVPGRAVALERMAGGLRVSTDQGAIETRRVLLAVSASEQPCWPEWASEASAAGVAVAHVFDPGFRRSDLPERERLVVVGGGITAAQTAMALAAEMPGRVTLLSRHPTRVRQFDSEPGWIGPRYLAGFRRERDAVRRREMIDRARNRGSLPSDVAAELRQSLVSGQLQQRTANVVGYEASGAECLLHLSDRGSSLIADQIILCTGFQAARPGGGWLDEAIREMKLPCAPCGYPIVDSNLLWTDGIYVTGALAELELGPVARNIVGARNAADRFRAA
jgi:cation diffusion facilitator CzcD-associated flavoprotein CzcO